MEQQEEFAEAELDIIEENEDAFSDGTDDEAAEDAKDEEHEQKLEAVLGNFVRLRLGAIIAIDL